MFAEEGISINVATAAAFGALLLAVAGALTVVFRLLMVAKDSQIAELREQRDSYKKGYERAVVTLEAVSDKQQLERGQVPIPKLAPPIPDHNSPTSERQKFSSEMEALKARHAAAELIIRGAAKEEKP